MNRRLTLILLITITITVCLIWHGPTPVRSQSTSAPPLRETHPDLGVTATSIVLGTVLPEKNALSGIGQSISDVLQAYFAEVNNRGGIYNRKIKLRVRHGDSKATAANVKRLIDDEQVFALVSGIKPLKWFGFSGHDR